jgi:hypothetical protein
MFIGSVTLLAEILATAPAWRPCAAAGHIKGLLPATVASATAAAAGLHVTSTFSGRPLLAQTRGSRAPTPEPFPPIERCSAAPALLTPVAPRARAAHLMPGIFPLPYTSTRRPSSDGAGVRRRSRVQATSGKPVSIGCLAGIPAVVHGRPGRRPAAGAVWQTALVRSSGLRPGRTARRLRRRATSSSRRQRRGRRSLTAARSFACSAPPPPGPPGSRRFWRAMQRRGNYRASGRSAWRCSRTPWCPGAASPTGGPTGCAGS